MNRREALSRVTLLMGGAVSVPTLFAIMEGCKSPAKTGAVWSLNEGHKTLLAELAELIIPKTTTPGAKEAGVGPFIEKMIADCYSAIQQDHFTKGLEALEVSAKSTHNKKFLECTNDQQVALLKLSEAAAKEEAKKNEDEVKIKDAETGVTKSSTKKDEKPTPFFKLLKELTLFGYFTSEQGATKALAYVPVPGKYEGCVKLEPGQKAWAI